MTDTEKKIAEVLDLSKPVSDCPECGGLGEIRSLGSRRKCECLYIRLKTLKRELDRKDEENLKLRQELEEAKAEAELEGQIADDANSDLNEALEENEQLRQERDMYKSSSEVFYERLKKVDEERNRMFERLKDITNTLGGVTFTDGRQWGAYNALCDIVEDIEKELSK